MPSSIVELRPNRRLLDHEFEGYKLNLQSLPHFCLELPSPVDRLYPDEIQFSFVHAKLFALHNHLILDFWDHQYNFYYVDAAQQVRNVTFDNINGTFQTAVVYYVPAHERRSGHFNPHLVFPSISLAVISDGTGYIHIVDTGTRNRPAGDKQKWNTLTSHLVLGEGKYFAITDARIQVINNVEVLHCLLQSVEQGEKHFDSILTWVTFENDNQSWKQISIKQIQGKGIVHYATLETGCTALYVASDNLFKFTSDSEREIVVKPKEEPKPIIYTWLQTSDDVTITLKLQSIFDKKQISVNVTPLAIKISYAGKDFLNCKLRHKVDSELTTWNVQEDGKLDVLITKSETMIWDELIEGGDKNGEQIIDASLVDEVHKRLAHLCSETEVTADKQVPTLNTQDLEECDAASEEDTVFVRMDTVSHEITHRVPLSVHQYLFSVKLETHEVPALALRHDVDACIWQPYAQLVNTDTWPIKHDGTLLAFGYVQSSKQNRKFMTCSPNFMYSVVSEASRHIFIYKSSTNQDCQLRRRSEGIMKNIKIGQQHVVNIDKYGEVLGICATNEYLFVLTETTLIAIGI